MPQIPTYLAERLGVDVFTAGLIVSAVLVIFTVLLVAYVIRKGHALTYGILGAELLVCGVTVALGWLPVYIFVVLILLVAMLYGGLVSKMIGGGR